MKIYNSPVFRINFLGAIIIAKVEIYTWSTCPFCFRAKQFLESKNIRYIEYMIDGDEEARAEMVKRGSDGKRSVPQIFIDDYHIGGSDALVKLDISGELDTLLNQTSLVSH